MKKIISLTLVLLLTLSLLTACGGNGSNGSPGNGSSAGNGTIAPPASGSDGSSGNNSSSESSGGLPPDTIRMAVGETKESMGFIVTLDEIWISTYHKSAINPPPEGHVFLYPHLTITNKDYDGDLMDEMQFSSMGCKVWIDEDKYSFTLDALYSYEGDTKTLDQLSAVKQGDTVKGVTGFAIPENWEKLTLDVNHMYPSMVLPSLGITFEIENSDYDPARGERDRAENAAAKASREERDPSLPLAVLNVGDEIENDLFSLKFTKFAIQDIPQLREGKFAENDPSESYYMELKLWITTKTDARVKLSFVDRSVNESIFTDLGFGFYEFGGSVGTIGDFSHNIQFRKDARVELDPTTIETVRLHYFVFDVDKNKNNYMEDPFYEGYFVFNTSQ